MAGYAVNGITRGILVKNPRLLAAIYLMFLVAGCASQVTATQNPLQSFTLPANTSQPEVTQTVTVGPTLVQAISCDDWQSLPIVPAVSPHARELYEQGQANGNHPQAFSKVGDGEISAEWFFTAFDLGGDYYDLGPYQNLRPAIDYFADSFARIGIAARRGFNTDRILDPTMSDPSLCESGESPLACELRLHRPAFAILSLGTNQVWQPEEFEKGMRGILDILVSKNIVPILSTKGDNLEGDQRINRTIACLAQEYDVPLWNFWSAIQPLPDHGLQPDQEHLTYGIMDFDDAQAIQTAWTLRNLTALQTLDAVWRGVTTRP
jgi:hypothetical protein